MSKAMADRGAPRIKGSARVANVLTGLRDSGIVPHYTPEAVGAETHKADEPGVIWVEVDHILDSRYQHQEQLDRENFQALVESIKSEGFLAALNVNTHAERAGYYVLTAGGHQRRDAAKAAGLSKIPVFVEPTLDPIRLAYRAAKENAIRVNTSPVNLGLLFLQMQDEFDGLTQDQIADELHKGRNFVKFCIMAARSAPDIQRMLQIKPDSLRAMTYLRRVDSEEDRAPIIEQFLAGELTTEGVQAAVEDLLQRRAISETHDGSAQHVIGEPKFTLPMRPPNGEASVVSEAPINQDDTEVHSGDDATAHSGAEEREVDPRISERVGKLKGTLSRLETYERALGSASLSEPERRYIEQLVEKGNRLLGVAPSTFPKE